MTEKDIQDAKERHSDQLTQLSKNDEDEAMLIARHEREKENRLMLTESFLDKISDMSTSLFKKDNDHAKIRAIDEVADPFIRFTDEIKRSSDEFIKTIHETFVSLNVKEKLFHEAYDWIVEVNRVKQVKIIKEIERQARKCIETLSSEEEDDNDKNSEKIPCTLR